MRVHDEDVAVASVVEPFYSATDQFDEDGENLEEGEDEEVSNAHRTMTRPLIFQAAPRHLRHLLSWYFRER
jgi:hypothetical protein